MKKRVIVSLLFIVFAVLSIYFGFNLLNFTKELDLETSNSIEVWDGRTGETYIVERYDYISKIRSLADNLQYTHKIKEEEQKGGSSYNITFKNEEGEKLSSISFVWPEDLVHINGECYRLVESDQYLLYAYIADIMYLGQYDSQNIVKSKEKMPEEMPDNFDVLFDYGVQQSRQHDSISTFDNRITKDLVIDGLAESELNMKTEQLENIYSELSKINIIDYPNPFNPPYQDNPEPDKKVMRFPSMEYRLVIQYNNTYYELYWHNENGSNAKDAITLENCYNEIIEIIQNTDAYKAFPESNGGYD